MIILTLKEMLDKKGITRYRLSQLTEIKFQTLDHYYKNTVTRYDGYILSKICEALDCQVEDILKYIPDEEANTAEV